jgi:hypothetical protein
MNKTKELDEDAIRLLMEMYDSELQIDSKSDIKHPEPALSYGIRTYQSKSGQFSYPVPIGTYGNFSFIQAPPKTKKTFLVSLLTATYLHGEINGYTGDLRGHKLKDYYTIHFDTEQGEFHASKVFKRPLEMSNKDQDNYLTYALRKIGFKERIQFIEWVLYTKLQGEKVGLIIIDGIADLCSDVNNIEEANAVVQYLMKWTAELNCHIITVIHSNWGSTKPTGHLGSFLEKKTETQIALECDENNMDIVNVKCKRSRNASFEDFSFKVNNIGLPEVVGANFNF